MRVMDKRRFDPREKGGRIDNIPRTGTLTGMYEIDLYGCWWEVEEDITGKKFWMIGEYPDEVTEHGQGRGFMDKVIEKEVELTDKDLLDYLEAVELDRQEAEQIILEKIVQEWMEDDV